MMKMRKRSVSIIAAMAAILSLMFTSVSFAADINAAKQNKNTYASMVQEIFNLVNQNRAKSGLPALTLDDNLCLAASIRSTEMAASNCFSHTRPTGQTCYTVLDELKIPYGAASENIAMGQKSAAEVRIL